MVSTIPTATSPLYLLNGIRAAGFTGPYLATAHNQVDARLLRGAGVDVVLDPFTAAAQHSSELIRNLTADTTP